MAFNRGTGFNRTKLNSDEFSTVLYSNSSASTLSSGDAIANMVYDSNAESDTLSTGTAVSVLIIDSSAEADTISSGSAVPTLDIYTSAEANTISSELVVSALTKVLTMIFSGTVAAGKTVCIDGLLFTVKNAGANAIDDFTGDFPEIFPETCTVVYTDAEGAEGERTVKIRVSRRDRHI